MGSTFEILPFSLAFPLAGRCGLQFKGRAKRGKLRKSRPTGNLRRVWQVSPTKTWRNPPTRPGPGRARSGAQAGNHLPHRRLSQSRRIFSFEERVMFGKLAGAFIGNRIAGRHGGAKGALLGLGVAAL